VATHSPTQSGNSSSKESNTEKGVVLAQVLTGTHALTQSGHSSTEAPYECRLPHLLQTRLLQPEQAVSVLPPKNPLLNGWKHTPHLPPPMANKVLSVVAAVAACPVFCRSRVCLCAVSPRMVCHHCHELQARSLTACYWSAQLPLANSQRMAQRPRTHASSG
jgi:hypothetical protein